MMLRLLLVVVGFAIPCCLAALTADQLRHTDDVIMASMGCHYSMPGMAVAVVKDDTVLLSKGYGTKAVGGTDKVTADTLFGIASLTKAFTASALVSALKEHGLSIKTPITQLGVLPADFHFNSTILTAEVNSIDLLAHRTGLPRHMFVRLRANFSIEMLPELLPYMTIGDNLFRDSFGQNDIMYGLAALITQKLVGQNWQDEIRSRIFSPLGMNRSTFIEDVNFKTDDVAQPYIVDKNVIHPADIEFERVWARNVGSEDIFSSANDMAQWMLGLLGEKGKAGGFLSTHESWHPYSTVPNSPYARNYRKPNVPYTFSWDTYGLGWKQGHYKGYRMQFHTGSTYGYQSFMTVLPEIGVGAVSLMTTLDHRFKLRTPLHEYLMDLALGDTPWINQTTICSFPKGFSDEPETNPQAEYAHVQMTRASSEYTGTYFHGLYGDLKVSTDASGALMADMGYGQWKLTDAGNHQTFHGAWTKNFPHLNTDFEFGLEGGRAMTVTLKQAGTPVFIRKADPGAGGGIIG